VCLAGSFNAWDPDKGEMKKDDQGNWSITVDFPFPGAYAYKFVVDNKWITDPDNFEKEQDGMGGYNSIFRVFASADTARIMAEAEKLLNTNPPCKENYKARKRAFKKLDSVLKPANIAKSDSVKDFFISRLQQGLLKLGAMKVIGGSAIMSVYNSGMIVKTPDIVIGLDVVSTQHVWGMNWDIPDEILKKLINLMDVLFITHRNPDHFDYDIAKGMIKKGKIVVAPESIADLLPRGALAYRPKEKYDLYSSSGKNMGLKVETFDAQKFVRGEESTELLIYRLIDKDGTSLVFTGDADYTCSSILEAAKTWVSPVRPGDEEPETEFSSRYGVDLLMLKGGPVTKKMSAHDSIKKIISLARPRYIFPVHVQEIGRSVKLGRDTYSNVIEVMKKMDVSFQMLAWGEIFSTPQAKIKDIHLK
jgi:hypothetical protein